MLKVKDNWCSLYWSNDDQPINEPKKIKRVRVEFADGTKEEYSVTWKTVNIPYSDMGHIYSGTQHRMYVDLNLHSTVLKGFPLYEFLEQLKVEIVE